MSHHPHQFKYMPSRKKCDITPTAQLAPLFEMDEMKGRGSSLHHLRRLIKDVEYRKEQMEYINAINRATGAKEVLFNINAVKNEISRITKKKKVMRKLKKIQRRAEILLKDVCTIEQMKQLEEEKRIEIIARNGKVYEILKSGKVNQLLANGKKKGLCVVMKKHTYPIADIIVAKKLMLEGEPEEFDKIAIPCSAFG
jgi:hypothetical protein